ncbi:MAG TPA: AMIN domain-containing protein [Thiolapillus brandeum]|uniref:N-acetylmuramoyl-L-alanine amidase AmiC n=1 Tax=Thiolapillus brandeum TaxID=1076588 RepID=A0A831NVC3_9GAMM|nr:AMIN domain-containing protein [Thiolapillus brandeum]
MGIHRAKKTNFVLCLFLLILPAVVLASADIHGVRMWNAPDHTRLVFDVSKQVQHRLFSLKNPHRLVIDFEQSVLKVQLKADQFKSRHISSLRYAPQPDGKLRVVFDLKQPVRPRSFMLRPSGQYGHRLVIDLYDRNVSAKMVQKVKRSSDLQGARDVVIAIDAGHGGEDSGARGKALKIKEKIVTLAIARKLKKLIDAEPGMRAVLTRKGDYYVGLRKRMKIARREHADFFVSIHADAFRNTKARGASVFVLSNRGASSEAARWLAAKENAADLVGGVSLDDKDDVLASVLLDLAQTGTLTASMRAARAVHKEMGRIGKLHGKKVQNAGFMVLKSPDIPSMLVETGFISNPSEERKLADSSYQQKVAKAVFKGIKEYFLNEPPLGTLLAMEKQKNDQKKLAARYVIRRGDTLSAIAQRHQVSIAALRNENRITSDRIHVGQVLRIPST